MALAVAQIPVMRPDARTLLRLASAAMVAGSAILLFAVHVRPLAYVPLVLGVALGWVVDRKLGKDLLLVAIGQGIISLISLEAQLDNGAMLRFTTALSLAVVVPWAISRYVYGNRVIVFPLRTGRRWTRAQWTYLGVVVIAAYLILPF